MKTKFELEIEARISKKGVRSEDIKIKDRLTIEQIADIEISKVFEWVKTGAWRKKDFESWLKVLRVIE